MKKFLPRTLKNTQGFTLVELMVVIVIIGILATAGLVLFNGATKNARDAKRRSDIDSIAKGFEQNANGIVTAKYAAAPVAAWFPGSVPPTDPTNVAPYQYSVTVSAALDKFAACANLEQGTGGNANGVGVAGVVSAANWNATNTGSYYCVTSSQ